MPLLFGQPYFGNVFARLKQLSPERYMLVPGYPDVEVKTSRSMPEGAIQDMMEEILRELGGHSWEEIAALRDEGVI